MGISIYVLPENVWEFFQKNKKRLSDEMVVIAENEDTGYAVYLTEEEDHPYFCVCQGKGAPEYEDIAICKADCIEVAKVCCAKYLLPITVIANGDGGCIMEMATDEPDQEDIMYEREDELAMALYDFLSVVLQEDESFCGATDISDPEWLEKVLDAILEDLATNFDMPIYRPMIITDDLGNETYTDYPYGEPQCLR